MRAGVADLYLPRFQYQLGYLFLWILWCDKLEYVTFAIVAYGKLGHVIILVNLHVILYILFLFDVLIWSDFVVEDTFCIYYMDLMVV